MTNIRKIIWKSSNLMMTIVRRRDYKLETKSIGGLTMTISRICIGAGVFSLLLGCASTKPIENVPLVWKPTSETSLGSVSLSDVSGVTFSVQKFIDNRNNKKLIGTNTESSPHKTVTTSDNVASWCTTQFVDLLKKQGIRVSDSGNVRIEGDVSDFNVNEGDEYKARVSIRIKAIDSNGVTLWDGVLDGSASRFGRSYSVDNYYETLTDAFIRGYRDLISNTSFMSSMKSVSDSSVSKVDSANSSKKGGKTRKKK